MQPESTSEAISQQNEELLDYLRSSQLLGNMPEGALKKLLPTAEMGRIVAGTWLVEAGAPNRLIYFLIRGRVGVYVQQELVLQMQRRGDIFGEVSALSQRPSVISIRAETDISYFRIDTQGLNLFDQVNPDTESRSLLYRFFATVLTDKLALVNFRSRQLEQLNQQLAQQLQLFSDEPTRTSMDQWNQARAYAERYQQTHQIELLDLAILSNLTDAVWRQIVALFLRDTEGMAKEFQAASHQQDLAHLQRRLRSLLNSSFGIGAQHLVNICETLQLHCNDGNFPQIKENLQALEASLEATRDCLKILHTP